MELRRLDHLVALAEERHFLRAAERVHLSQPAFSRSIQTLEAELGLRLFDRGPGEVRPTPAGAFLVARARLLLFEARCLKRDFALYRDGRLGDTAFGAGPFPAATLLPDLLPRLRRDHEDVRLRVEIGNAQLLLDRLQAEDIEFFVADIRDLPANPAVEIRPLGRLPGWFYARAGHPLAGAAVALDQVWGYGLASVRAPAEVMAMFGRHLGLPPGAASTPVLECDDLDLLKRVALETDTVLFSADGAVRAELAAGSLVRLALAGLPPLYAEMGVVSLRGRTPSPMAAKVIEGFGAAVRDL
jgi:DNA-binding transcriptional LysR family regulator